MGRSKSGVGIHSNLTNSEESKGTEMYEDSTEEWKAVQIRIHVTVWRC